MRGPGLSALVASFLAIKVVASPSPECYTVDLLSESSPTSGNAIKMIHDHLASAASICHQPDRFHVIPDDGVNNTRFLTYAGPVVLEISSRAQNALVIEKKCSASFNAILDGCAGHNIFAGGRLSDNIIDYSLYLRSHFANPERGRHLEARGRSRTRTRPKTRPRPKLKSRTKTKPKTKPKPKPKPKPTPTPKPKSKTKTKTQMMPKPKPKSKSKPNTGLSSRPKPTPSQKPTATQTKIKIGPTKNCKQLALAMQTPSKGKKILRDIEMPRGGFLGSRVDINSREELLKRVNDNDDDWESPTLQDTRRNHDATPKPGTGCGITFNALDYPTKRSMETTTGILGDMKYHIEHILEWQAVAKFFDWMDRKKKAEQKTYQDPDLNKKVRDGLSFCQYWKAQWKGAYPQPITINGKTLEPIDHMAQAYPGLNNRLEEFVWLQATINTPAKSSMWSYKGIKENAGTLYNVEKMREFITGEKSATKVKNQEKAAGEFVDTAKTALTKLKALLGARKYMRDQKVSDIFGRQVENIRKMLDDIDNEMPKHPRTPGRGAKAYEPWIKQDLAKYWIEYMNERFEIAKTRTHNDMNTYLKLIDDKWCDGRPKSKSGSPANSRPGSRPGSRSGSRSGTPDPVNDLADLFK
ncbi:hypothetical protein BU23DRAFT_654827 [Bimuria novae-zelandiae CBS 107.79]|uniref:Uncharacterized protein n=1 Tax=Bimuria novae-zelandiae CBS 107.79 TaxID=1447943 RepID=A0A6A5VKQ6_9PLEO|nr:hypothetical protein BU23DRAFT_654827 [Bimuria novae-zelandiae CBS 107.79]